MGCGHVGIVSTRTRHALDFISVHSRSSADHLLSSSNTNITEVAAAVILRPGEFLLAQRPEGKPYPGYWEFPGGKIEPGEDARAALARELREELGIEVREATPWITRMHTYTHATVRLHFFRVIAWDGEPQPLEDQAVRWQVMGRPDVAPMLPANAPVLAALDLPEVMVVSRAAEMGLDAWVLAIAHAALRERLLVQLREKTFDAQKMQHLLSRTLAHVEAGGSRVVVNGDCGAYPQCGGLHMTSAQLMAVPERPTASLLGASCHDARELDRAGELGVDYALLGPVEPTPSHPEAAPLGWSRFAELARERPMPVYAIGGLTRGDLDEAKRRGAHGVALRGAAFQQPGP